MNSFITVLLYGVAIVHCLTDRVIAPYLLAIFNELAGETAVTATAAPVLTVAEPPAKVPATKAPAKPRPARRRKSTVKVAA